MTEQTPGKKQLLIHPFFFALFPIVSMIAANISEVGLDVLYKPAAVALVGAAGLFLVFGFALRRAIKGALVSTIWLFLFFSYGHLYNTLIGAELLGTDGQARYVLIAWLLLGVLGSLAVIRTKRDLANLTRWLNFMAVIMLALPLINIVSYERSRNSTLSIRSEYAKTASGQKDGAGKPDTGKNPDIYYLIFDRYSSAPQLKKALAFDNSGFTEHLEKRGFFVADQSQANYAVTYLSLASSLNLEYHEEARDQKATEELLQDYRVWRFLKERGYKFIHYGSAWPPTNSNRFADQSVNYYELNFDSFSRLLLNTTMAGPVLNQLYPPEQEDRNRILSQLKALSKAPEIKGPKFVFAHMLMPHTPYLFDSKGQPIPDDILENTPETEVYLEYVAFANTKIKALIDNILATSEQPPVIIIQADEGFRYNTSSNKERYQTPGFMQLHYGILNAYYLPGIDSEKFVYDSITPVNSFRAVFNAYFDADLELLKDESYLLVPRGNKTKDFKRITGELRP